MECNRKADRELVVIILKQFSVHGHGEIDHIWSVQEELRIKCQNIILVDREDLKAA